MIFFTAKNFLTIAVYSYRLRYFWKKCENDIRFEKAEKFVNSIRRFSTSTSFQQTAKGNNEPVKTKKRSFFGKKKLGKLVISNWAKQEEDEPSRRLCLAATIPAAQPN